MNWIHRGSRNALFVGWWQDCNPCLFLYERDAQGQTLNVMATDYYPDMCGSFCELCMGRKRGNKSKQIHPCYWRNNLMCVACSWTNNLSYRGADISRHRQSIYHWNTVFCRLDHWSWFSHRGQRIHPNPLMLGLIKLPHLASEILVDTMWAKGLTVLHSWTWHPCSWHLSRQEDDPISCWFKEDERYVEQITPKIWLGAKPRQVTAWNRTVQQSPAYIIWMVVNLQICEHENK